MTEKADYNSALLEDRLTTGQDGTDLVLGSRIGEHIGLWLLSRDPNRDALKQIRPSFQYSREWRIEDEYNTLYSNTDPKNIMVEIVKEVAISTALAATGSYALKAVANLPKLAKAVKVPIFVGKLARSYSKRLPKTRGKYYWVLEHMGSEDVVDICLEISTRRTQHGEMVYEQGDAPIRYYPVKMDCTAEAYPKNTQVVADVFWTKLGIGNFVDSETPRLWQQALPFILSCNNSSGSYIWLGHLQPRSDGLGIKVLSDERGQFNSALTGTEKDYQRMLSLAGSLGILQSKSTEISTK